VHRRVRQPAIIATIVLTALLGAVVAAAQDPSSRTVLKVGQAVGSGSVASAPEVSPGFSPVPGLASDIGVGADGSVWALGASAIPWGFHIWRLVGNTWVGEPGAAVDIAVGPNGDPWVVNSAGHIYHWNGAGWTRLPGVAKDVGVGADGSVWAVGASAIPWGFHIWRLLGNTWVGEPGAAVDITVGANGDPWVVNSAGHIFHWSGAGWTRLPGSGTDVAVSARAAWALGGSATLGGVGIWHWTGSSWAGGTGGAVRIAVDPSGNPWVVNSSHQISSYSVTQPGPPPPCVSDPSGSLGPYSYSGITNSNGFNTYVGNNMWAANTNTTQTTCASNPGSWSVVANAVPPDYTGVQTYPDVQQLFNDWNGSGWNGNGTMSDTPISKLKSLTSSYASTNPTKGDFELAWDIWLSNAPNNEIMIWVYNVNRGTGGSTVDAHTTLGGQPVTYMNYGSEQILSFDHNQASGTVDILAALQYLQSLGVEPANATIGQIDFGWEICNTAGQALTFGISNYSLTAAPLP
jgi:hypothetical protein